MKRNENISLWITHEEASDLARLALATGFDEQTLLRRG